MSRVTVAQSVGVQPNTMKIAQVELEYPVDSAQLFFVEPN